MKLFIFILLFSSTSFADTVELLLKENAPSGLLIEVIEDTEEDWRWLIPKIKQTIKQARGKFPHLPVAIVSHGKEEMALVKNSPHQQTRQQIQSLVKNDQVDFYVCAVQASWHQHQPEDFPSFVNVASTGPAQMQAYIDMGYFLIRITQDE